MHYRDGPKTETCGTPHEQTIHILNSLMSTSDIAKNKISQTSIAHIYATADLIRF